MSAVKILGLNGSPIRGGNTEILIREILRGAVSAGAACNHVVLNELVIKPCQSCGKSPEPESCFLRDDMDPLYRQLREYDGFVLGSPIYFDTVSAQMKLFIDRCNCLRPLTPSEDQKGDFYFKELTHKKRPGAMVLVGGERQEPECARQVIAGFFAWASIVTVGQIFYVSKSWRKGEVAREPEILKRAFELGELLVHKTISGRS
jgi:multimeric flavodoxin WrbA